jgi:hypothetical protein
VLERDGIPIGIVERIAGPSSYRIRLTGEGGHAGAVLMPTVTTPASRPRKSRSLSSVPRSSAAAQTP